ncbi:MAG: Trk family potassium uptake protein [Ruminococcaceae bacterium]|nr:Trk family potassium uptake protein [Oscillospiraceae bacterium]
MKINWKGLLTTTQLIALTFAVVILIGAVLLQLPVSSANGESTPFLNALLTATSATCVTGLIAYDTATHWSLFGKLVILVLIQIGGLGFMTIISLFAIFLKKKLGLFERRLFMQSAGAMQMAGVTALMLRILYGTLIFEGVGAILLAIRFCPQMGIGKGIFYAVFHSVSAFCNAGFDLMGVYEPFSSFVGYADDVLVNLVLMLLIIIGGLGFLVWQDIFEKKTKLRDYELHTKIVLATTAILLLVPTVLFFLLEADASGAGCTGGQRLLRAAFHSVTVRTAGFNTVDLSALSDSSYLLTLVLMLIGGSPGSTAGGLKTTTFAVLILAVIACARHNEHITVFRRRLSEEALRQACAIFVVYVGAALIGAMLICAVDGVSLRKVLFETVSAIGTVGLSMSLTPTLGSVSRLVVIVLMFAGRVGGMSLMLAFAEKRKKAPIERPSEKILIG